MSAAFLLLPAFSNDFLFSLISPDSGRESGTLFLLLPAFSHDSLFSSVSLESEEVLTLLARLRFGFPSRKGTSESDESSDSSPMPSSHLNIRHSRQAKYGRPRFVSDLTKFRENRRSLPVQLHRRSTRFLSFRCSGKTF